MIKRRRKASKSLVLAIILVQLILLAVRGCTRVQAQTAPTRCGVEAPRYPDDDDGDMGYIPEPGEKCR